MKNKVLTTIAILALMIASCKKEVVQPNSGPTPPIVSIDTNHYMEFRPTDSLNLNNYNLGFELVVMMDIMSITTPYGPIDPINTTNYNNLTAEHQELNCSDTIPTVIYQIDGPMMFSNKYLRLGKKYRIRYGDIVTASASSNFNAAGTSIPISMFIDGKFVAHSFTTPYGVWGIGYQYTK